MKQGKFKTIKAKAIRKKQNKWGQILDNTFKKENILGDSGDFGFATTLPLLVVCREVVLVDLSDCSKTSSEIASSLFFGCCCSL